MSTYLYLIMHFILKLQKSLYPAFKARFLPSDAVWHFVTWKLEWKCLQVGTPNIYYPILVSKNATGIQWFFTVILFLSSIF